MKPSSAKFPSGLIAVLVLLAVVLGCNLFGDEGARFTFNASPDGRKVVFSTNAGDLFLFDRDSEKVTRITKTPGIEMYPSISPDGKSIVYAAEAPDDSSAHRIFKIDVDSKKVEQLTKTSGVSDTYPKFDTEGKRIYFARGFRSVIHPHVVAWLDAELMVINADGTDEKQLTKETYHNVSDPVPLPGGRSVLFQGGEWGGNEGDVDGNKLIDSVYMLDLQGTDKASDFGAVMLEGVLEGIGDESETDTAVQDSEDAVDGDAQEIFGPRFVAVGDMIADLKKRKAVRAGGLFEDSFGATVLFIAKDRLLFIKPFGDDFAASEYELWESDLDGKNPEMIAGRDLFRDPLNWKPGS